MPAKRTSAPRAKAPPVPPIPKGFRTMTPYLCIDGAANAMEFYKRAFGATELLRQALPNGKLIHGRLQVGDSIVMLSDFFPGGTAVAPSVSGTTTVTLHVYSKDVATLWARAVKAGATVLMPLDTQFWGEKYGQLRDPFGHVWSLSQQVPMSAAERDRKQKEAMARFAAGPHPD
ncbi:MAG: VOC family protein [Thermoplasmata archaeon]|nr:VOC family protein [Thermoplasmata archaeon]